MAIPGEPRPRQAPKQAFETPMTRLDHYARTGEPGLFVRELISLMEDETVPFMDPNPRSVEALAAQLKVIADHMVTTAVQDAPLATAGAAATLKLANELGRIAPKAKSRARLLRELHILQGKLEQAHG